MSEVKPSDTGEEMSRDEMNSALFAHMVMQQSNMAMMLLGKVAHPETGKTIRDLEAAKLFIDQLEMLEMKTKGNLSNEEGKLLKQSLMSLRMAFVDAVNESPGEAPKSAPAQAPANETPRPDPEIAGGGGGSMPSEESHKKFSKKY